VSEVVALLEHGDGPKASPRLRHPAGPAFAAPREDAHSPHGAGSWTGSV